MKKFVEQLISPNEEELKKMAELEEQGKFNDHTSVWGYVEYDKVDENFCYLEKNNFKNFLMEQFTVKPFIRLANKLLKTKVVGKGNLKGLNGAVVCCNHINKLDCCAIFEAIGYKKTYFVGAEFNNYKGKLGKGMRVGGLLPLSNNIVAMKNFKITTDKLLKDGNNIVFFPEGSEWWCYKKPRPVFDGAFKIATSNNKPILPLFITFVYDDLENKMALPQFVVNILPPIYPDNNKNKFENIEYLKNDLVSAWFNCYKTFYKEKL